MILIFSQDFDQSTFDVIEWLKYYNKDFILLNDSNKIKSFEIRINNKVGKEIILNIEDRQINVNKIEAVWYRRNSLSFLTNIEVSKYPQIFFEQFKKFIYKENYALQHFLFSEMSDNKINRFSDEQINKLETLKEAAKVGLLIPNSSVFFNSSFPKKFEESIHKPISDIISFYYEDYMCFLRTQLYSSEKQIHFPPWFKKILKNVLRLAPK